MFCLRHRQFVVFGDNEDIHEPAGVIRNVWGIRGAVSEPGGESR
jgi:hypothetical protein